MSISTNSVVHYTDSIEKLKSILKLGFKVKYCLEKFVLQAGDIDQLAYPMVSFCDIPFTEIRNHIESYGYYGIGLTKKWAREKKLNPVIYIDTGSNLADLIDEQMNQIQKAKVKLKQVWADHILHLAGYIKNYSGELIRGSTIEKEYVFYKEREWRFVPTKDQLKGNETELRGEDYLEDKEKYNEKLKNVILEFTVKDISYILVKTDAEIVEIIKEIRSLFADKCTMTQLEILLTKVHSIENIINDF